MMTMIMSMGTPHVPAVFQMNDPMNFSVEYSNIMLTKY